MQCEVYKSLKQFDYFLFVKKMDGISRVPDALRRLLGELEKVMDVDLHNDRALAQSDVVEVMRQLEKQGYYLQMPAQSETPALDS